MLLVAAAFAGVTATSKSIIWTKCDTPASLAAATSWVANTSTHQLSLISAEVGGPGALCMTHPGPEVPAAWGPHVVAQPCDASAVEQRWAFKDQMLQYMGEPSAAAVCIQADASTPWENAPAATWPCPSKPAWNTAIAQLKGSGAPGAIKLQLNMKVDKLCLSYATAPPLPPAPPPPPPAPPPPPPPPPACSAFRSKAACSTTRCEWASVQCVAKLATPTPQQLVWQDYEMGALHTVTPRPPVHLLKPNPSLLLLLFPVPPGPV